MVGFVYQCFGCLSLCFYQNFRRSNTIPNGQRESDHQVIPPFKEKFLDEDEAIIEESEGNTINMFEIEDSIHNCYTEEDQPSPSY